MARASENSLLGIGAIILVLCACASHMCSDNERRDKVVALTDSIEKKLEEKDSTLRKICDIFADGFRDNEYYDKYGNEYKCETCYNEEGDSIGKPQELAAKFFDFLKERIETDCYAELEEIRETLEE